MFKVLETKIGKCQSRSGLNGEEIVLLPVSNAVTYVYGIVVVDEMFRLLLVAAELMGTLACCERKREGKKLIKIGIR